MPIKCTEEEHFFELNIAQDILEKKPADNFENCFSIKNCLLNFAKIKSIHKDWILFLVEKAEQLQSKKLLVVIATNNDALMLKIQEKDKNNCLIFVPTLAEAKDFIFFNEIEKTL